MLRAFDVLESAGRIEARPRSGYYVSAHWAQEPAEPRASRPPVSSTRLDVSELVFEVLEAVRDRQVIPLGSAFPDPTLFPLVRLARHLAASARRMSPWDTVQHLPPGSLELRRQISRRYLRHGARVSPEEIIITSGALEALNLSLQVLTRPGDVVVIESPAFYGCLQAIEVRGLRAVEVPTHPQDGVDLPALDRVLRKHPVRACWLMSSFQNPLGSCLSDVARRELVRLLAAHDVPLIDDDVYGDLYFGRKPPATSKSFDKKGLVLHCGSFSKSLAPGYRIGWVAAGRYAQALQRRKMLSTLATSIPVQGGLASYLDDGGYEKVLKGLRRELMARQTAALAALRRHLPAGYAVARPEGGYFLWVQLAGGVDAIELHWRALARGVSIAPGPIFSARRQFRDCVRLNYGHPSPADFNSGIAVLGDLARTLRQ